MFYDQPDVAAAYLESGVETVTPTAVQPADLLAVSRALASAARSRAGGTLRRIARGKEAIFAWDDPLPFLAVHHLQIPSLLFANLRRRRRLAPDRLQHRQAGRAGG